MPQALSMRLIRDADGTSGRGADPVRRVVQAVLVLYLSPVILTVLALGTLAVATTRCVTLVGRIAAWAMGWNDEAGLPVA